MIDKSRVWVSLPTFPGVTARLEPHFEMSAEPEEREFSPHGLAGKLAGRDAAIVGLKERIGAAEIAGTLELDDVVLGPHIAGATADPRRAMTSTAVDNVLARFGRGPRAGRPPNILNPNVP